MNPDPLAPARGCLIGSCLGCLCWGAIFSALGIFSALAVLAGAWA